MTMLDRHTLDQLARAGVSGRRSGAADLDRLANKMAALMHSRLRAAGAPGARRTSRQTLTLENAARMLGGRDVLAVLVRRVDKHLAPLAQARLERADPR